VKKLYGLVVFLLLIVPGLFAQEHYTEGPIWCIQLIRVIPTQMDAYLTSPCRFSSSISGLVDWRRLWVSSSC